MSKLGLKAVAKDKATLNDGTTLRCGQDLLEAYHSAVYDLLTTGQTNKTAISGFIKKAYNNLGDKSLATIEHIVKDTANYYSNKEADEEFIEYKLSKELFTWQKDLLSDKAKKITLLCGRRSGKSFAESAVAVNHCIKGSDKFNGFDKPRKVAIIGLTVSKTVDVFWENVKQFAIKSCLKHTVNNSEYSIIFSNGSSISLFGNNSKAEREKIRGSEYSLIIIDEAQSQNSLEYLLTDILEPIIVGRDSTIILSGTGSLTGYGKWADITTGNDCKRYKHYTATMKDNPTVPDCENALVKVLEEHGWTEDNITYQREYLAKNVIDTTRMVFPTVHYFDTVPDNFIAKGAIVGVDYGFSDYNAFAGVVFDEEHIYLVSEEKFNHSSVTDIIEKARAINEYIAKEFKVVPLFVADNSDQSISRELFNRGIKIQNAYKVDTNYQISVLKEWLENATLLIHKNDFTDKESKQTVWKWDETNKSVIYEIDDDYFHPDILHALRYAVNYIKSKYRR